MPLLIELRFRIYYKFLNHSKYLFPKMGTGFSCPFMAFTKPMIHIYSNTKMPRIFMIHPKIGIMPMIPNAKPVKAKPKDCLM